MDILTSSEVCGKAEVTYRQLNYWRANGVLEWVPDAPGSGIPVEWTEDDARIVAVLGRYQTLVGNSSCADLSGLAAVAHAHCAGVAVRFGEVWEWHQAGEVPAGDAVIVVSLTK